MKIGLGTAQFGLDYGITNLVGQTSSIECHKILDNALKNGCTYLDTSPAYGNAENVLGSYSKLKHFEVITKTRNINSPHMNFEKVESIYSSFINSLETMNINQCYTY